jgi:hypothetical protein
MPSASRREQISRSSRIELLGRMRSDRMLRRPTPSRIYNPKGARPPKHGAEFVFGDPTTWQAPRIGRGAAHETRLYGRM